MTAVDDTYLLTCPECAAVVLRHNRAAHTDWHRGQDQVVEEMTKDLADLTKVVGTLERISRLQFETTKMVGNALGGHLRNREVTAELEGEA